ncbi:MAG: right-handed parallel beta-helix repeat-containing protein [Lentisphaeria bacterium]|nr:right-handed parallel beta-helix repeat-containing protein [Lentisphaeria bacterium]
MVNVRETGAIGDGVTKDTLAVQKAIDSNDKVFFPAGIYLCGTLYLHSNTTLELENGAVILGSPDPEDYNKADFCVQNTACIQEKASGAHLIVALECSNVTIRGGKIDGNYPAFFDPEKCTRDQFEGWRPSQMIFLCECTRILLEDVELTRSPYWACFLHGCSDAVIRGVKVWNHPRVWNGDGLDIDCCSGVIVTGCNIESSDDSLAIRAAGKDRLKYHKEGICEDIVVSNCILKSGQAAIRIGVGSGTVRRCIFSNISVRASSFGICMLSTYLPGIFKKGASGVQIEDILFSDMILHAGSPIDISANWIDAPLESSCKEIRNVTIRNIRAYGTRTSILQGNCDRKLKDVLISDCSFIISGGERISEDPSGVHPRGFEVYLRSCAFYIVNAESLSFRNCSIRFQEESENYLETIRIADDSEIAFSACEIHPPRNGVATRKKIDL